MEQNSMKVCKHVPLLASLWTVSKSKFMQKYINIFLGSLRRVWQMNFMCCKLAKGYTSTHLISERINMIKINSTDKHIQELCKHMEIGIAESNLNRK